jgi:hypothetical protein
MIQAGFRLADWNKKRTPGSWSACGRRWIACFVRLTAVDEIVLA